MMKPRSRAIDLSQGLLAALCILMTTTSTSGYELLTHARISEKAFDSSLGALLYLQEIGSKRADVFDPDKGSEDLELSAADSVRFAQYGHDGTARGWFAAGSIREDDYARNLPIEAAGCEPSKNPPTQAIRMRNHFFDVQRSGQGLTFTLPFGLPQVTTGYPAPDWALGLQGRGTGPQENRYSIRDARNYQLQSLTAGNGDDRARATARLFRSLGHVAHVLQDMAQPQHTRNDPHAGCFGFFGGGERSWYEKYIERRAKADTLVLATPDTEPRIPTFPAYRDHWTNATSIGLADFSSRNFLSAGTNFGRDANGQPCGGLGAPPCTPDASQDYEKDIEVVTLTSPSGIQVTGNVEFFRRGILHPLTGETIQILDALAPASLVAKVRLSTRSLWDEQLRLRDLPVFSMNTYNYDEIAAALLPRAVEYSAGLLDHFFRGHLDLDVVADSADPTLVRLVGRNLSSQPLANGALYLFVDDDARVRTPVPAIDSAVIAADPGGAVTSGRFQSPPAAERVFAVYTGGLGPEVPETAFPGAVIGKKLGGVRVEEVFADDERWRLRTPTGVFDLPLTTAAYEDVKWGDGEMSSLLVHLWSRERPAASRHGRSSARRHP